jgi:hypothetical protein
MGICKMRTSVPRDPNDPDLQSFNPLFPKGSCFGEDGLIGPVNFIDLHPTIELHISKVITLTPSTLFFWRQSTKDGLYGLRLIWKCLASRVGLDNQPAHWCDYLIFAFLCGTFPLRKRAR